MTMFTNPQRVVTEEAKELRKAAGAFLRAVRERQGLTQHDVGTFAGYRYYTQYSALEQGTGRVPPERYAAIAAALGLAPSYFARKMMRYYDPLTFAAVLDEADIEIEIEIVQIGSPNRTARFRFPVLCAKPEHPGSAGTTTRQHDRAQQQGHAQDAQVFLDDVHGAPPDHVLAGKAYPESQ